MSVNDNPGLLLHMVNCTKTYLIRWQVKPGPAGVCDGVCSISLHCHHWDKQRL